MNGVVQNGASKLDKDRSWQMTATYVEIYNEQLRDLLLPEAAPAHERSAVTIREDVKGRIMLTGLQSVAINTVEDLLNALNHGSTIRQTDATAVNAKSSRSHAIFSLTLVQRKSSGTTTGTADKRRSVPVDGTAPGETSITTESKLHFVDLAGSERLKNTGASGERAKEGISINSGLASLGKVISQLSSRQAGSHVSYRDSKLTRLLQDSLGGNAITYMIACVTPAEFHLSETLNTVQYAQRARAIQSRPQIQQISDDSDKQALIDRLRAEVAFLRQQISSSEGGDRRNGAAPERMERQNEREVELQNHLLDVQESYTTLSQRHAKLISELTKSGDSTGEKAHLNHFVAGESAVDRLKRSQANQEQIEQVVLEYEKTIQSLEASLSNTRSSLANTESSLLERETKCAYVETVNSQLHARVQKLMDREANNDSYLRELESRLDGQSSGNEKNDTVLAELRKEIARIRESEINSEDYISTLEERLAEADQDMELMQREVERLEHVVERQRSLGKLDNLLFELDHIQQNGQNSGVDLEALPNVKAALDPEPAIQHQAALQSLREAEDTALPEEEEENEDVLSNPPESDEVTDVEEEDDGLGRLQEATRLATPGHGVSRLHGAEEPSPAQSRFMAEKFETVNQELVDLQFTHESTVKELDLMSAKYQEALNTLAQMQAEIQDIADEDRHLPRERARDSAFLEDARVNEQINGGHLSSSRSLSSELSAAGESAGSTTPSDIIPITKQGPTNHEVGRLQSLLAEHEQNARAMTEQYVQLQAEHQATLGSVEELKAEVHRTKLNGPPSPITTMPNVFRRKSSQIQGADRAHRSINSLRSIITEELEGRPDRVETVEVHLNAASHELQSRLDRIQSLEAENANVKREMENKSTIISGLTRERNSLKSPVSASADLSMVNQMRDQLIQAENAARSQRETHVLREAELIKEIQALKEWSNRTTPEQAAENDQKTKELEAEVSEWQAKHQSTLQNFKDAQQQLESTLAEQRAAHATIETLQTQQSGGGMDSAFERAATAKAMQNEREQHEELIDDLKHQIDDHKQTIDTHVKDLSDARQQLAQTRELQDQRLQEIEVKDMELAQHREDLTKLEQELEDSRSAVEFHKHGLKSLHEAHANAIEEMKLSHSGAMAEIDDQLMDLSNKHDQVASSLKSDIETHRNELGEILAGAQKALGHPTSATLLVNHIQDVVDERNIATNKSARLAGTNAALDRQISSNTGSGGPIVELEEARDKIAAHQETIRRLAHEVADHEETLREKDAAIKKHESALQGIQNALQNKARIVEELEQQIENSFDQHHNRMSVVQHNSNQALVEAQTKIALLERDIESMSLDDGASRSNTMKSRRPQSPPPEGQVRSNSMTSNLRKSASIASLPSPPPAIPLPPLPALPSINLTGNQQTLGAGPTSPTQSRHASKEIGDRSSTAEREQITDLETRVRTIEKHLHAEKQLTATLEEALVDLETQSNKIRADSESWKKKAWQAEEELQGLRKERRSERLSIQAVEEEKNKRREAEAARAHLEERMQALSRKKKKNALNCF